MKKENVNKFFLEKFLAYNLHNGSSQMVWDPTTKPYLQGIRHRFCILNLLDTQLYLRQALRFLKKLMSKRKKILFIGSPCGLEKEFSLLCSKKGHYWIENWSYGSFTNSESSSLKLEDRPSLLFIFDLSVYQKAKEESLRLDIPIMAFVNSDESLKNVDYPIPANIKSWKGGLFVYNLFFHLFQIY